MTILSDRTIRWHCTAGKRFYLPTLVAGCDHVTMKGHYVEEPMIKPFCERTVFEGMTYGLSCAGYDIRVAEEFRIFPHQFVLASSMEKFSMPWDIVGVVHDKSSWARKGLAVQNTILEPGWKGFLTLELTNHRNQQHLVKSGTPIAQIVFHRMDALAEKPYGGKYQNQVRGAVEAIEEKS